jgi:hypothetical protein
MGWILLFDSKQSKAPAKSAKRLFSVIPVKTGIQRIPEILDSRLRGSDTWEAFYKAFEGMKLQKIHTIIETAASIARGLASLTGHAGT